MYRRTSIDAWATGETTRQTPRYFQKKRGAATFSRNIQG